MANHELTCARPERGVAPEEGLSWERRWLRLRAVADVGADRLLVRRARRVWRNLVAGLASQPGVSLELCLEKPGDGAPARAFWALSCAARTQALAEEKLEERAPDCGRILAAAEQFIRFEPLSAGEEPLRLPLGHVREIGRRLEWSSLPSGELALLPCPWIPAGSSLDEFLRALELEPGAARLVASLRRTALTREERWFLGCAQKGRPPVGFIPSSRSSAREEEPCTNFLFELSCRLETAKEPSFACLHELGAAITEPPLVENCLTGGFVCDEPGLRASALAYPRLYHLHDLRQVLAVFRLPVMSGDKALEHPKLFFPSHDSAKLETRGSTHLGTDVGRPGCAKVCVDDLRRRESLFVLGATGAGKSNLLQNLSLQSIRRGAATCVIDFHGDLTEAILARLGPEDRERLVYFNAADVEYPCGLNLLAADGDPRRRWLAEDRAIQSLLVLFEKQYLQEHMGPMFQMNVKNAIQLVLANPDGATLLDVPLCFMGPKSFRKKLLEHVTNPLVRNFWTRTYEQTTEFHKSDLLQYIISKFTPLIENPVMRNILGQTSSLDFSRTLAEKKILLCSLQKGIIGEQHAALLATIIMQKLEEALYARVEDAPECREDVFLYLDEVHNLARENVGRLVSEARKFGACLTFATQVLEQLDPKMRHAVLGNASTIISFRVGAPDAAVMADYFRPALDPSVLMRLPNYHAAVRLLAGDRPRYAVIETLPPEGPSPRAVTQELREYSREQYGCPREVVEREIFERLERQTRDVSPVVSLPKTNF